MPLRTTVREMPKHATPSACFHWAITVIVNQPWAAADAVSNFEKLLLLVACAAFSACIKSLDIHAHLSTSESASKKIKRRQIKRLVGVRAIATSPSHQFHKGGDTTNWGLLLTLFAEQEAESDGRHAKCTIVIHTLQFKRRNVIQNPETKTGANKLLCNSCTRRRWQKKKKAWSNKTKKTRKTQRASFFTEGGKTTNRHPQLHGGCRRSRGASPGH